MMHFIRIVRAERFRVAAPAVQAMACDRARNDGVQYKISGAKYELRAFMGILVRFYLRSKQLAATPPALIVLPERGHKYDEVITELQSAGLHSANIARPLSGWDLSICLQALNATIRAFPILWRCFQKIRMRPYAEVLASAKAFTQVLQRRKVAGYWIIIGDLSPFLIALSAACRESGQRVVYWQYSYLDFKPLLVAADVAVLLNDTGRTLARTNPATPSYWRPRDAVCPVRLDTLDEGPIGAMLNVHADHRALERLDELARWLNRTLEVRLHPNSALDRRPWPETLTQADPAEELADFVRRHALLLGGNTQAQAKALTLGTPVVHCDGLDPLSFDHHGYVASGILPGCACAELPDMELIKTFFSSADYARALSGLMGPEPDNRHPALDAFVAELTHSAQSGRPLSALPLGTSAASRQE